VIDGNLNRWIAHNKVALETVALGARCNEDAIGVAYDRIVLNNIVGIGWIREPDTKITSLSCISISTDPVRTEPVA
jgi:hypothetical protein